MTETILFSQFTIWANKSIPFIKTDKHIDTPYMNFLNKDVDLSLIDIYAKFN